MDRRSALKGLAGISSLALLGDRAFGSNKETKAMKYRGVVYDVGLNFSGAGFSVEPFDPELVNYDLHAIAKDLHANAVRIEGEEISRLVTAARAAHKVGLTVFFNPWKMNASLDETLPYYVEAARAAEALRKEGVNLVFVAGCETTLFSEGAIPGKGLGERLTWFGSQFAGMTHPKPGEPVVFPQAIRDLSQKLNEYLKKYAAGIREEYKGPLSYSAGMWEEVDWSIFDIVGIDHYRQGETDAAYLATLESRRRGNKPLVVMEVGCCAYDGAAARGGGGFAILQGQNPDGSGIFAGGVVPTRNEREQADYYAQQINILSTANILGMFLYVFSFPSYRTGVGAKDLDMVSFSLVKTLPVDDPRSKGIPPWLPKEAFHRVSELYGRLAQAEKH